MRKGVETQNREDETKCIDCGVSNYATEGSITLTISSQLSLSETRNREDITNAWTVGVPMGADRIFV